MKKITLLLAFFICLNISLNAQTYPKKENVIRLLTYNTHYCKGGSDPGSIDDYNTRRLASVIEALDPDVVALQELDSAMSDRRRRDLLKQISEFTGLDYQHFFGGLAPINGGKVGPGLLFKKRFESSKERHYPVGRRRSPQCGTGRLRDILFHGHPPRPEQCKKNPKRKYIGQ